MSGSSDLFPTLDADWAQELTTELRIRGVDGTAIGEALATAEAHCRDSGESALDAFGPAREYAETVPAPARDGSAGDARLAVPAAIGVAGMLLSFRAVDAWQSGTQVSLTFGTLLTWSVILGATLVLVRHLELVLRGRWRFWLIVMSLSAAIGALSVAPTPTLLHLTPGWAAVLVAGLLCVSVVWSRVTTPTSDAIRHPLRPTTRSRSEAAVEGLTPWLFVILALVVNGVFLLL